MEKAIINQIAPEFTLKDQNGTNHSLSDYRGEWILLFFYLKDGRFTGTQEAKAFGESLIEYSHLRARAFGVSVDTVEKHKKFVEKHIGENAMLFEVEEQKLQYKRGTGVYDSNEVENYATENLLGFFFENPLAYTPNMEAFKRFHGTEAAIWSWDSMCMIGNNGYLVRLS